MVKNPQAMLAYVKMHDSRNNPDIKAITKEKKIKNNISVNLRKKQ